MSKEKTTIDKIFEQLVDALDKLKLEELRDIFKRYDHKNDELILSSIEEWNDNFSEKENDENVHLKYFIEIGDKVFNVNQIFTFEKELRYDFNNNKGVYVLIINKSYNTQTPYKDTEIKFKSSHELEKAYEGLKTKLYQFNIRFI